MVGVPPDRDITMSHIDETVMLADRRVLRLHADGTYQAKPPFGFPTGPEHRVGAELSHGKANMVFRPDKTYDLEYVEGDD
jgi:hypothetical protein